MPSSTTVLCYQQSEISAWKERFLIE